MERKLCARCGNWFTTKGENTMCQYCIAIVMHEIDEELHYRPPKVRRGETQLDKDIKAAKEQGLSYGYYMAWKEGRR